MLSGWAYEDKLPDIATEEILEETAGDPIYAVLYQLGINSLRGDVTKHRSEGLRNGYRELAMINFRALTRQILEKLEPKNLVYLGTTGLRKSGDDQFYGVSGVERETLKIRSRDIDMVMGNTKAFLNSLNSPTLTAKYLNACQGMRDDDIQDKHGHPTRFFLGRVVNRLSVELFEDFDL